MNSTKKDTLVLNIAQQLINSDKKGLRMGHIGLTKNLKKKKFNTN